MYRLLKWILAAVLCGLITALTGVAASAQDPPEPPDPAYSPPGMFEGRGVSFVVVGTDDDSLFIASSDTVVVVVDYSFDALTMHIKGIEGVTSVTLSISGLSAATTYHQYVDHFTNHITLETDEAGATTFVQDVSAPHVVMIQTQPSTIYLTEKGFEPDVGTWDPVTRTGTLTQDIHETIEIIDHDITLDGNGYLSDMPGGNTAVYVYGHTNVTIRNLTANGASRGLLAYYADKLTVSDNEFNDVHYGIVAWGNYISIVENVINHRVGKKFESSVQLRNGKGCLVATNTCRGGRGIELVDVNSSEVVRNILEDASGGLRLTRVGYLSVRENECSTDGWSLICSQSDNNEILNNSMVSVDRGVYLSSSRYNVLRENTFESQRDVLRMYDTKANILINNNFISHLQEPPLMRHSTDNTFSENPPVGGNYWNIWCPPKYPDEKGDGFVDKEFYLGEGNYDYYPLATPFQPQITQISGTVYSDCGSTAGLWVRISLDGKEFNKAYTDVSGAYIFENLPTSGAGRIWLDTMPQGYTVIEPPGGALDFDFGQVETCDFVIHDIQAPVIVPKTSAKMYTSGGDCKVPLDQKQMPVVSDNCPEGLVVEMVPPASYRYPIGTTSATVTASDAAGNVASMDFDVIVRNPAPAVTITGPPSGILSAVGEPVEFSGTFSDENGVPGQASPALWTCNDDVSFAGVVNGVNGSIAGTHTFEAAGVYLVTLTVTDDCGGVGTASTVGGLDAMVVVYDPSAGFVTGGGWINSPAGAYAPDDTLVGKANFGFVSKYKKGATTPSGQTEFRFKVADMNFHSTSYDWLVIAGPQAKYKGDGTINDEGSYKFMLSATDGAINGGGGADKFRIKIVDNDNGLVVYDNMMGMDEQAEPTTTLGGGSVVIHSTGGAANASALGEGALPAVPTLPDRYALGQNHPNPFNPITQIGFDLIAGDYVDLVIYDAKGRVVRRLLNEPMPAGRHTATWDGTNDAGQSVSSGVYFYRIQAGSFSAARRMVLLK